jgi:hypothetical protein
MNRGLLLACCVILFLLSAAITSRLANDDGPFEPRQVPQPIIADAPAIVVPPPPPETDSRREQLKRIISSIEAPDLEPALPIVGMVRMEDGTPIAGATIVARAHLQPTTSTVMDGDDRLLHQIEDEVRAERMNSSRWQSTSDASGRFKLTDLALTRYRISVKHPKWDFQRTHQNTTPGTIILFLAQEPRSEVDLQVRLADGSIPPKAEVAIAPGRYLTTGRSSSGLGAGSASTSGSTLINQIVSKLDSQFNTWTPEKSTREVKPGHYTVIARSTDGQVSDPLEVFIEKSARSHSVLLEIPRSGGIHVDVADWAVETAMFFHLFLLRIDGERPPPLSALFGGMRHTGTGVELWPRSIPSVPPGTYLVGVGSSAVIWDHRIVEVSDQSVEIEFDLSHPGDGNILLARVVDDHGHPLKARFDRRAIRSRGVSSGSVDSFLLGDDGIYRIALTDRVAQADQLFLSAKTEAGSIEMEVGEDPEQIIEFRFGNSAKVQLNISGFDEKWERSLQIALVLPGEKVGQNKWQRAGGRSRYGSESESPPGFISKDLGTVQAGQYDIAVGLMMRSLGGPPFEVLRMPISVGSVGLEIPIGLPRLYQIEVLQIRPWPLNINTPGEDPVVVFLDRGEGTISLPSGTFEISSGTYKQTIEVPRQRQIDLRGEE